MSDRRTRRRSISIRGLTYQRLKTYCEAQGISLSGYIESVVCEKIGPATAEDLRKFDEDSTIRQEKKLETETEPEPKPGSQEPDSDDLDSYVPPIQLL
jgi:hypothetical protein